MDCERALEAVMEARDLGRDAVPDLAEAQAHCGSCDACRSASRAFAQLDDVPAPVAPPALTERVVAAIAAERAAAVANAAMDAAEAREAVPADFAPIPVAPRRAQWVTWVTVGVSAAAVLAIAVGVTQFGLGILGVRRDEVTLSTSESPQRSGLQQNPEAYKLPTPGAPADTGSAQDTAAQASARFITYDGRVWKFAEGVTAERSELAEKGKASTDLGTGTVRRLTVLTRTGDRTTVFLEAEDGTLSAFTLVTRLLSGDRFALTTNRTIDAFGEWPELPSSIPKPISADGSPTFQAAGPDDLGVTVFPMAGTSPSSGFAIPPQTAVSDPAGGNPNWTWWEPLGF